MSKLTLVNLFNPDTGKGFLGIICRDEKGLVIAKAIIATSPLMAGVLSLGEAATFAAKLHLNSLIFETRNLCLVDTCIEQIPRGEIKCILDEIKALRSNFVHCGVSWVG